MDSIFLLLQCLWGCLLAIVFLAYNYCFKAKSIEEKNFMPFTFIVANRRKK
jgi:hypothetical protein